MKKSVIAKNTIWMFVGQGGRAAIQALYFIVIARTLGPEQYGVFVALTAAASILAPFSRWGLGNILIKEVARKSKPFEVLWGQGLVITICSGVLLTGVFVLGISFYFSSALGISLVVFISFSELVLARLIDLCGQAFQAYERLRFTAQFQVLLSIGRLIAACIFMATDQITVETWSKLYFISTLLCAIFAIHTVHKHLGGPQFQIAKVYTSFREGFYFSLHHSAHSLSNDIDKTMLARLSTLGATGIYASAYKMVDIAFTPVRSLLFASYSEFFKKGAGGINDAYRFALKLMPIGVGYGLVASVAIYCFAPLLPYVIGSKYGEVVEVLRWLAILPLLKPIQYFAGDILTGAGYQGWRVVALIITAAFNIVANLLLIPTYSWRGAAWASVAADSLLLLLLWAAVGFFNRQTLKQCVI
jgi:O-antigen/teichoic acid export membrane protein